MKKIICFVIGMQFCAGIAFADKIPDSQIYQKSKEQSVQAIKAFNDGAIDRAKSLCSDATNNLKYLSDKKSFNSDLECDSYIKFNEVIHIPSPSLPPQIKTFLESRGLKIQDSLLKFVCGESFDDKVNPSFIKDGDFDGDQKHDYVFIAESANYKRKTPKYVRKTFVILANGQVHEINPGGWWSIIILNKKRGAIQTLNGPVDLKYDSFEGIACQKSSALYVFNKNKGKFDEFFTSD